MKIAVFILVVCLAIAAGCEDDGVPVGDDDDVLELLHLTNDDIDGHAVNDDTIRNLQIYGSVETTAIHFVDGEHTVQRGDHILFVGFKTIVHLGNSSNTPDGMRIILRPNMDTDGDKHNHLHSFDPIVSCERSGCDIYLADESVSSPRNANDLIQIGCMGKMEFVFHAARNSWYEL
jgi:hypothetical protein